MSTSVMFCQGGNVRIGQRAVDQNKLVQNSGQLESIASRAVLADVDNGEAVKGVVDQRVGALFLRSTVRRTLRSIILPISMLSVPDLMMIRKTGLNLLRVSTTFSSIVIPELFRSIEP